MPFPSDRLAAHLAHLLNPPQAAPAHQRVPAYIHAELSRTLAGPRMASQLLHQPAYAWRMGPEESAEAYLSVTLHRVLRLTGRTDRSVAHKVLLALLQRGPEAFWANAELHRMPAEAEHIGTTPFQPAALRGVAAALARLPAQPDPGSAAQKIRARDGILWLCCLLELQQAESAPATPGAEIGRPDMPTSHKLAVADEISIWTAIETAILDPLTETPRPLRELQPGHEFNAFCALFIDALRTANRPVQEVLGLGRGLCPFDWVDVVPINQLRVLRRFLAALPVEGGDSLPAWEATFARHPVPGHASAQALWDAPIGRALRRVEAEVAKVAPSVEEEIDARFNASTDAFVRRLGQLRDAGALSPAEARAMVLMFHGAPMEEALPQAGITDIATDDPDALQDFVADLLGRIEAALSDLPESRF